MATKYSGGVYQPKVQGSLADRLATYASDRGALDDEIARAKQVYSIKAALGDTQGANAAHDWANKLRQVGGISSQYDQKTGAPIGNPYDQQVISMQTQLMDRFKNPAPIDVYNTDAYKAAMAESQRQAGLATRNTQESLGNSGFARSTNLSDRVQRIQNDSNNYLQTQVAPAIYSQEQAKQQQQVENLRSMLAELRANQGLYDNRQQVTIANQRQNTQDALSKQFGEAGLTGKYQGRPTLAKLIADANIANANDGNALGWANYGLNMQELATKPAKADTTMKDALDLAVRDGDYEGATPAEKKAIIDNYYNLLRQQSSQDGITDQDILDMISGKK